MCNALSIICSVALSIASTNDYRFMSPGTTNLVGRGMGPNADYVVPRAEDIAFLREAYAERICLLRGVDNLQDAIERQYLVAGGNVPASGDLALVFLATNYVTGAFGPTFGRWNMWSESPWGPSAQFVSPDFAVSTTMSQTDSTYRLNGRDTDTLAPFVAQNTAVPLASLCTNLTLVGVLKTSTVAGAYSNVVVSAAVCSNEELNHQAQTAYVWKSYDVDNKRYSIESYGDYVTYTYTDGNGNVRQSSYPTTYTVRENASPPSFTTNSVGKADVFRYAYVDLTASTETPYSFRYNDASDVYGYTSVRLPSYNRGKGGWDFISGGSFDFYVESDFLGHATNYVSLAKCAIVMRVAIVDTDTISGNSTQVGSTSTTNHYVLSVTRDIRAVEGRKWKVDFDLLQNILPLFSRAWVGQTDYVVPDLFHPEKMNLIPQSQSCYHTRESRLAHIDIYPYVYFTPQFKVRVLAD